MDVMRSSALCSIATQTPSTGRHLDPMDLVTKNLVSSFKDEESLPSGTDDATVFEHFANFCVVSQDYGEEFDVDDVHTAKTGRERNTGGAVLAGGIDRKYLTSREVERLIGATRDSRNEIRDRCLLLLMFRLARVVGLPDETDQQGVLCK